jgi:cytochrome P450
VWKVHRRIINRSFNTKTINSFVSIIDKHVTQLMTHLEDKCDDNYVEVLEAVFRCNLDIACGRFLCTMLSKILTRDACLETMTDVDSRLVEGQSAYMANTRR